MRTCLALLLVGLLAVPASANTDRIYGVVTTTDGDTFEGLIRWDKNEVSWVDVLDGSKHLDRSQRRDRDRTRFEILGLRFETGGGGSTTRTSGVRFGHLAAIENIGSNRARLTLRSGEEIEFHGGSTDIGNDIRSIVVEDARRGTVELRWRDIERVDFRPTPRTARSRFGERLYGTLTTQQGDAFTGYICWDIDEVLAEDLLDGDDEEGRRRKIPFGEIARIERNGSRSADVTLVSGRRLTLDGTNDVNSSNKDILILDPGLGQIRVDWDEFDVLVFEQPTQPVDYRDFRSSGRLLGTVFTRNGNRHEGLIRWDDDEAAAWELLNGERDDVEFFVEMGLIAEIERLSHSAAFVTLRDGRTLELRDSNDVDDDNDGIFILLGGGDEVRVDWDDFDRVVFAKP